MKYNLTPSRIKPPLSRYTRKAIANALMAFASPENKLTRAEAKMQVDEHVKKDATVWHSKGSHKNPRRRSKLSLAFYTSVDGGYQMYFYRIGSGKKPCISRYIFEKE